MDKRLKVKQVTSRSLKTSALLHTKLRFSVYVIKKSGQQSWYLEAPLHKPTVSLIIIQIHKRTIQVNCRITLTHFKNVNLIYDDN